MDNGLQNLSGQISIMRAKTKIIEQIWTIDSDNRFL